MNDDALLARLNRLLTRVDPVPEAVVQAARASLGWRSLDAALARLVADSMLVAGGVRGGGGRLLTFEADEVTIEIEISPVGGRLRMVGQVIPPSTAQLRAEQPDAAVDVAADEMGRFSIADLPTGPTRFVCVPEGVAPVRTEWTIL